MVSPEPNAANDRSATDSRVSGKGRGVQDENEPSDKVWIARFSSLGLQFALTLGGFTLIGYWLDRTLGWSPWLTICGAFFGFAGGTISLYRRVFPTSSR